MQISAFGDELGKRFGIAPAPTLVARMSTSDPVTMLRLRSDKTGDRTTLQGPPESAFVVHVLMRPLRNPELYHRKERREIARADVGSIFILDMEDVPGELLHGPFDIVRFYVSRSAVRQLAEANDLPWNGTFEKSPLGATDGTLHHLAAGLLATFEDPASGHALFVDSVVMAFLTHLLITYGGAHETTTAKGGLSPWQLRRVKDFIEAHLSDNVALESLSLECRLSTGHFARAFRISVGRSPHQFSLDRRIDAVKRALSETDASLTDAAAAHGFADQSHLTKVFAKSVGSTPGAWRRANPARRGGTGSAHADATLAADALQRGPLPSRDAMRR